MTLRVYRTEKGTILSDEQGNILDLNTLAQNGHAIYEKQGKAYKPTLRVHQLGEYITIQHNDDIAQLTASQENPNHVLDLVGSFPLPVRILDVREYTREQFAHAANQVKSIRTAYERRKSEIEHIYQTHLADLKAQEARLLAQKNEALAALFPQSLDDTLFAVNTRTNP